MKTIQLRAFISRSALLALVLPSALAACDAPPDRYLGGFLEEQSSGALAPAPSAVTEPFGASPDDFVGRWIGAAENPLAIAGDGDVYAFPSGSTQIVLELERGSSDGTGPLLIGDLTFGEPRPAPPVDASLGYPSDAGYDRLDYFQTGAGALLGYPGALPPYEGFSYTGGDSAYVSETDFDNLGLDSATLADGVLRFGFDTEQILDPWCAAQEPLPLGDGEFGCIPGHASSVDDAGACFVSPAGDDASTAIDESVTQPVDCGKLFLCQTQRCFCDDTGCYPGTDRLSAAELRLRRNGDGLVGVFDNLVVLNPRGLPVPLGPARFTRAP